MEIIEFNWMGLHLQEPMALVTNWMLAAFCFFAWFRLRKWSNEANYWWRLFFLTFGISTIFGGLGHLFFQYTGVFGKYPCWITGCLANAFAARGMIELPPFTQNTTPLTRTLPFLKSAVFILLAVFTQKFVFVAIDAIVTYIGYTGIYGWLLRKRGADEMKYMIAGVLILLPSAFIFGLKMNLHRLLNKDDFSHLLMLGCIFCFYLGMTHWGKRLTQISVHV